MKLSDTLKDMKNWIILILIAIFSYWGLNNLGKLLEIIKMYMSHLSKLKPMVSRYKSPAVRSLPLVRMETKPLQVCLLIRPTMLR